MNSASASHISAVHPLWAVEGGRVTLAGSGFPLEPALPEVRIGNTPARLAAISPSTVHIVVPEGLEGGHMPVRIDSAPGETVYVDVGSPFVTGVHQVDSPAYDAHGNLFVTFSGSRGQQAPVAIYIVRPDGSREPFVADLPNPTSLAFDGAGRLHVSSRFEGTVHRIASDGTATTVASDLGVPCGIAFSPDGVLHVGDRSGSILRVHEGRAMEFVRIPPSVAAFHLAFGPDGDLFVTAPTLATHDPVYRVTPGGQVTVYCAGFGRPQGIAFDSAGDLFVVDALAGSGGVFRVRRDRPDEPEQVVAGGSLIGIAFDPRGGVALASADTVYRLSVNLHPLPITVIP